MRNTNDIKKAMTDKEFEVLERLYDKATKRKIYILVLTTLAAVATLNGVVSLTIDEYIPGWMGFLGAGISVVVYGIVAVFAQMNDTVYDISTSIRPDFAQTESEE